MYSWIVRTKGKVSDLMKIIFRQMEHKHTTRIPSPTNLLMRSTPHLFPGSFPFSAKIWTRWFLSPVWSAGVSLSKNASVYSERPSRARWGVSWLTVLCLPLPPSLRPWGSPPIRSVEVEQTLGAAGLRREEGKLRVKWRSMGALQESLHPRKEKKNHKLF